MTNLESLESKLNNLRQKWKGKVPKETDTNWSDFLNDKSEAECLKSEIEKIKQAEDTAKESDIDCYQCKKKALTGSLFPFCSPECKKQWQDIHFKDKPREQKYRTIEECQRRLKELKMESQTPEEIASFIKKEGIF